MTEIDQDTINRVARTIEYNTSDANQPETIDFEHLGVIICNINKQDALTVDEAKTAINAAIDQGLVVEEDGRYRTADDYQPW